MLVAPDMFFLHVLRISLSSALGRQYESLFTKSSSSGDLPTFFKIQLKHRLRRKCFELLTLGLYNMLLCCDQTKIATR